MVELRTDRLILRELTLDDVPALNAVDAHPDVAQWVWPPGPSLDETREYITSIIERAGDAPRTKYVFAIVNTADSRLAGRCGFDVAGPNLAVGEVGYALGRDHWGAGYMTEAVTALFGFGFGELGLHRMWAEADPRNVGSWRVMEKVGMRREAHMMENYFFDGGWCDTYLYAILAREWASLARTT